MLCMQAYVFHDHERRDTRPYIRANVETFAHPAARPNVLKQDNKPLTWKGSLVPIPDNKVESLLKMTASTSGSASTSASSGKMSMGSDPGHMFRNTWLKGMEKELRSIPPSPAGADVGDKTMAKFQWKDVQSPTKKM
ncbi:unnamed protein product [Amoebophrya sp. A120]|nr:unnamed protein product [Amoebophrya sp. A120]|eukprot:GSA120T00004110001.1